jgi:hypothetical protein
MPTESHGFAPALAEPDRPKEGPSTAGAEKGPNVTNQAVDATDALGQLQAPSADPLKAWRTAQARALLLGFSAPLIDGDDGRPLLVVSRWALCRSFADLGELEAWLQRVEGKA